MGYFFVNFYQRLRDLREDNDLTQVFVASLLGIKYQQYARYENGIQQMSIENYKILARYYNVSIDYLSGLSNIPKSLDGTPFQISKSVTVGNIINRGNINIKN